VGQAVAFHEHKEPFDHEAAIFIPFFRWCAVGCRIWPVRGVVHDPDHRPVVGAGSD
jgi:hypothetical protein